MAELSQNHYWMIAGRRSSQGQNLGITPCNTETLMPLKFGSSGRRKKKMSSYGTTLVDVAQIVACYLLKLNCSLDIFCMSILRLDSRKIQPLPVSAQKLKSSRWFVASILLKKWRRILLRGSATAARDISPSCFALQQTWSFWGFAGIFGRFGWHVVRSINTHLPKELAGHVGSTKSSEIL